MEVASQEAVEVVSEERPVVVVVVSVEEEAHHLAEAEGDLVVMVEVEDEIENASSSIINFQSVLFLYCFPISAP